MPFEATLTKNVFLTFTLILFGCNSISAQDSWVGKRVMPKEGAVYKNGTTEYKKYVPLPITVQQDKQGWLYFGDAWILKDKAVLLEEAPDYYNGWLRRKPDNEWALWCLGISSFQLGKFDQAVDAYTKGQKMSPTNAAYYPLLGSAWHQKGHNVSTGSDLCFKKGLMFLSLAESNSRQADAGLRAMYLTERAELWDHVGKPAATIADIRAAYTLQPTPPRARWLSDVLLKSGKPAAVKEAISTLTIAIERFGNNEGMYTPLLEKAYATIEKGTYPETMPYLLVLRRDVSVLETKGPFDDFDVACAEVRKLYQSLSDESKTRGDFWYIKAEHVSNDSAAADLINKQITAIDGFSNTMAAVASANLVSTMPSLSQSLEECKTNIETAIKANESFKSKNIGQVEDVDNDTKKLLDDLNKVLDEKAVIESNIARYQRQKQTAQLILKGISAGPALDEFAKRFGAAASNPTRQANMYNELVTMLANDTASKASIAQSNRTMVSATLTNANQKLAELEKAQDAIEQQANKLTASIKSRIGN